MSVGGGGKAPISIGINPTIAFYSIILGGACALAAYTEKYRRDQDEIDDRLKERYFTNMKEQQAKMPLITQTIRGQDARLDDAMNKWVWGGKADLSGSTTAAPRTGIPVSNSGSGGGGNTSQATLVAKSPNDEDEPSSSEEDELDSSSSSSDSSDSDSSSSSMSEEEREQEKKLSKKERRQRRKERKQRREARRKKREEEKRRLEAERQKLVYQSVAAGVAVGAVAVGVTMLVGNRRN